MEEQVSTGTKKRIFRIRLGGLLSRKIINSTDIAVQILCLVVKASFLSSATFLLESS